MKHFSPLAAISLAAALALGSTAHARPIADSTGVQAITGVAKPKVTVDQLPPEIANQDNQNRSWFSYFLGQERCKTNSNSRTCFKIDEAGTGHWLWYLNGRLIEAAATAAPYHLNAVSSYICLGANSDGSGVVSMFRQAWPTGIENLKGGGPSDFDFDYPMVNCAS